MDDAKAEYAKRYSTYGDARSRLDEYRRRIEEKILSIGNAVVSADILVKAAGMVLEMEIAINVDSSRSREANMATDIEMFGASVNRAARFGVGAASGGALAVGSWALVAATGTASTGTAIAGLSGVAATNAILAWFGGGALAAGGAGMSGGAAVLGGIFAAPILIFFAWGLHATAAKYEAQCARIDEGLVAINESLARAPEQLVLISIREAEVKASCRAFTEAFAKLMPVIMPWRVWSFLKQRILSALGVTPFNDSQVAAIRELRYAVERFVSGFQH